MSSLLVNIQHLAEAGNVRASAHGFEELSSDDISFIELVETLPLAVSVEEYQDYHKGPCVLVLHTTSDGSAVHALWGLARNAPEMATLVTAYRPSPSRWSEDFLRRKVR